MKKTLIALVLISFLAVLAIPTIILAAGPTVSGVGPALGVQGATLSQVFISGDGFKDGSVVPASGGVSFGTGITVNSYSVNNNIQIEANITIALNATTGARNVSVTDSEGTGTLSNGFTVSASSAPTTTSTAGPVNCVKLGANVKWTGTITGTTGATPFNCKTATENYCLFIAGKAIGEVINAGDCGETAAVITQCNATTGVWTAGSGYFTQVASCLTNAWGMIALLNGIGVVTNWIFVILMIVVALFIIWGAFDITTAAGSPEKVTSGRGKITYALIGLAVALLAKALPGIISALLGV